MTFAGPLPPVMLVRDDESPSTGELLRCLRRAQGRTAWLPAVPPRFLATAAKLLGRGAWSDRLLGSLEVDDAATRIALGWAPSIALDDGLARMVRARPAN